MSHHNTDELIKHLPDWADEYIQLCLDHKKEVATGSGKIVEIADRHIPTICFFLNIWLPTKKGESIDRTTWYEWINGKVDDDRQKIIKAIDDKFKALAGDIVANEQKGIFYAKNKLGWTDRVDNRNENFNHEVKAEFGSQVIQPSQESGQNT